MARNNNKFNAQSFSTIVARHGLTKVFDSFENSVENYYTPEICQSCRKLYAVSKCRCKHPDMSERGFCNNYVNCDSICGGTTAPVCECASPVPPEKVYITVYESHDCYGGPEEGGWWYSVSYAKESFACSSEEQANAIRQEMLAFADELNKLSKDSHNRQMAESLEWLEARGLDADFLPEPDGEDHIWIAVELYPGKHQSGDNRPQYS